LQLDSLKSLTLFDEPFVRHFSGTTIYRNTFEINKQHRNCQLSIDLGEVGEMADVWINGIHVGFLWKKPYSITCNGLLRVGQNDIEVRVINLWTNRLIGDAKHPDNKTTYTVIPFYGEQSPLLPSGLMGPVRLTLQKIR